MKILQYVGTFDLAILRDQLLGAFPTWREDLGNGIVIEHFGLAYDETTSILSLMTPDDADELLVQQAIDAHDPSAQLYTPLTWQDILEARQVFLNLPSWATWTPDEAETYVNNEILNGMTKAQVEAYIDANITGTTVATLREQVKGAFKLVAGELIDLRLICGKMAYAIMLLRNVAIRRRV